MRIRNNLHAGWFLINPKNREAKAYPLGLRIWTLPVQYKKKMITFEVSFIWFRFEIEWTK